MNTTNLFLDSYLAHHGIKGMKWGVRRYQNKNGTLTAAGRKRYIADRTKGIQKDIDSYAPYRKSGIKSPNGKLVMSPKDIDDIVNGLEQAKNKVAYDSGKRYDRKAERINSKNKNILALNKYAGKAQRQIDANMNNAKNLKKMLDSNYDDVAERRLTKTDRQYYTHQYETAIDTAKKWMSTRDDIMNMKISDVSVEDVKRRFNSSGARVYYPFA